MSILADARAPGQAIDDARLPCHSTSTEELEATYITISKSSDASPPSGNSAQFARPEKATKVPLRSVLDGQSHKRGQVSRDEGLEDNEEEATGKLATGSRFEGVPASQEQAPGCIAPTPPRPPSPAKPSAPSPPTRHASLFSHLRHPSSLSLSTSFARLAHGATMQKPVRAVTISAPTEVTHTSRPDLIPSSFPGGSTGSGVDFIPVSLSQDRSVSMPTTSSGGSSSVVDHGRRTSASSRRIGSKHKPNVSSWFSRNPFASGATPGPASPSLQPTSRRPSVSLVTQSGPFERRRIQSSSLSHSPSSSASFARRGSSSELDVHARERRTSVSEAVKTLLSIGKRSQSTPIRPKRSSIVVFDSELVAWPQAQNPSHITTPSDMVILSAVAPAPSDSRFGISETRRITLTRPLESDGLSISTEAPSESASGAAAETIDVAPSGASVAFRIQRKKPPALLSTNDSESAPSFFPASSPLRTPSPPPSPPPDGPTSPSSPKFTPESFPINSQFFSTPPAERSGLTSLTPPPRPRSSRGSPSASSPSASSLRSFPSLSPIESSPNVTSSDLPAAPLPTARRLISANAWSVVSLSASTAKTRKEALLPAAPIQTPIHDHLSSARRTGVDGDGEARGEGRVRRPLTPPPSPPSPNVVLRFGD